MILVDFPHGLFSSTKQTSEERPYVIYLHTGCPTLLETVNLELKLPLMVVVMVLKFSGLLAMYIGFYVHLSKMG